MTIAMIVITCAFFIMAGMYIYQYHQTAREVAPKDNSGIEGVVACYFKNFDKENNDFIKEVLQTFEQQGIKMLKHETTDWGLTITGSGPTFIIVIDMSRERSQTQLPTLEPKVAFLDMRLTPIDTCRIFESLESSPQVYFIDNGAPNEMSSIS